MGIIKLLILVNSLNQGGAERQLITLLKNIDKLRFRSTVVTYYSGGMWEDELRRVEGITVSSLKLRGRFDFWGMIFRLGKIIAQLKPHIVYGLCGDACTLALLHGKLLGRYRVAWGIRASRMDFRKYSIFSAFTYRLNAILSRYADLIVANSWDGAEYHSHQGYSKKNLMVIPNGIDTRHFRSVPEERVAFRNQLGLAANVPLIGRVGRLDPMKDYETFLKAASILLRLHPEVKFAVAGTGPLDGQLKDMANSLNLDEKIFWLGPINNLPAFYSACTFTTSSSFGEGFPNVVAESLACETPCVATDVGDSAKVLGPGGIVVPPKDPKAMASAWEKLLGMHENERIAMGQNGREHIEKNFNIGKMVSSTEEAFSNLAGR